MRFKSRSDIFLNKMVIEDKYFDKYTKTINYKIVSPSKQMTLPNVPPYISLDKIEKMTNKFDLKDLEKKYDDFLDKYVQILLLYDNIDVYLEIRDVLTQRISDIERLEKKRKNQEQNCIKIELLKWQ